MTPQEAKTVAIGDVLLAGNEKIIVAYIKAPETDNGIWWFGSNYDEDPRTFPHFRVEVVPTIHVQTILTIHNERLDIKKY